MATGLVIIDARYGPAENGDALQGLTIDVTIPLQALVTKSQLYIPGRRSKVSSRTYHTSMPSFLPFFCISRPSSQFVSGPDGRRPLFCVRRPSALRPAVSCTRVCVGAVQGHAPSILPAVMAARPGLVGDCSKPLMRRCRMQPRRCTSIMSHAIYPGLA